MNAQPLYRGHDKVRMELERWLRASLDLLAPPHCVACDLELREAECGFCDGCGVLLDEVEPPYRPPRADAAAFVYAGPLKDALARLKYGRRSEVAAVLGKRFAARGLAYAGRVDAVVPVPLHRTRRLSRGFNQAALLARPLARSLAIPLWSLRLRRVRNTRTQVGLSVAERTRNVKGAFSARLVDGARVLLVDDVRTSGATGFAAATALRAAGAEWVGLYALARTPDGELDR